MFECTWHALIYSMPGTLVGVYLQVDSNYSVPCTLFAVLYTFAHSTYPQTCILSVRTPRLPLVGPALIKLRHFLVRLSVRPLARLLRD